MPEPAVEARATSTAVQARPPSSASGSSSADPLELPGMEGLLAFGPDQLDDLAALAAGAEEDEGDQVQTTAAQGSTRPLDASPGDTAGEQALQAGAAPEDASGGLGVLQVLTLAILGLAAAVATSIALRPRRRSTTRVRSKTDAGSVRHEKATRRVLSFAAASPAGTNHLRAPHENRTEVPMSAPPPPVNTVSDVARPHIPDVDLPRTATPRSEVPSPDLPRSESPRPEGPRPAARSPEVPRPEATRPDVAYPPIGSTRNEARHAPAPSAPSPRWPASLAWTKPRSASGSGPSVRRPRRWSRHLPWMSSPPVPTPSCNRRTSVSSGARRARGRPRPPQADDGLLGERVEWLRARAAAGGAWPRGPSPPSSSLAPGRQEQRPRNLRPRRPRRRRPPRRHRHRRP